jgi:hypothetical protein
MRKQHFSRSIDVGACGVVERVSTVGGPSCGHNEVGLQKMLSRAPQLGRGHMYVYVLQGKALFGRVHISSMIPCQRGLPGRAGQCHHAIRCRKPCGHWLSGCWGLQARRCEGRKGVVLLHLWVTTRSFWPFNCEKGSPSRVAVCSGNVLQERVCAHCLVPRRHTMNNAQKMQSRHEFARMTAHHEAGDPTLPKNSLRCELGGKAASKLALC